MLIINEQLFLITTFLSIGLVFLASRLGKEFLFASIVTNLILISTFGSKLVIFFGLTTNVGNVFYAAVFLATHMLIEQYGKEISYKTIWVGLISVAVFVLLGNVVILMASAQSSLPLNIALQVIFRGAPRIALASLLAFLVAQSINVKVYSLLLQYTNRRMLWLRDNASNVLGQFVDSVLFFSIAFFGVIPNELLLQTMLVGFLIKVFVGLLGTPFLYLTNRMTVLQNQKSSKQ